MALRLFSLAVIYVVLSTSGANHLEQRQLRTKRADDVDEGLFSLQTLVSQQASMIQTLQSELTATHNRLGMLETQQTDVSQSLQSELTAARKRLGELEIQQTNVSQTVQNELAATHNRLGELETQQTNVSQAIQNELTISKTLQSEFAVSRTRLGDLENASNNGLRRAESRLSVVENKQLKAEQMIAFTVGFSYDPVPISGSQVLKFNHYISNIGGGYDPRTGIFTAPVSGLYVFYLKIMDDKTGFVEIALYKDNVRLLLAHADHITGEAFLDQGSILTPIQLDKGHRVWIQRDGGPGNLRGNFWTIFSGFLIRAN